MKRVFSAVADCPSPMRLDKYVALLAKPVTVTSDSDRKNPSPSLSTVTAHEVRLPPTRSALKAHGGAAYINGKASKMSSQVHLGDIIRVEWEEEDTTSIAGENIPLDVIYEDNDVVVVNKPQGMVTHPAAGHWSGTLVNALLGRDYFKSSQVSTNRNDGNIRPLCYCEHSLYGRQHEATPANYRPGIVHRLDKDTSGVIITARNDKALLWLQSQFKARAVRKEYIAITRGHPPAVCGVIDLRICRAKHDRKKFTVTADPSAGRAAKTIYHCIACYGEYSIMRLRLKTGRTHQIRVHLKHIGCPIVGDSIYYTRSGKPVRDSLFPDAALMLHSRLLEIRLPFDAKRTLFIAPVPQRFIDVLKTLEQNYPKESN